MVKCLCRGNSQCKGPKLGTCLAHSRKQWGRRSCWGQVGEERLGRREIEDSTVDKIREDHMGHFKDFGFYAEWDGSSWRVFHRALGESDFYCGSSVGNRLSGEKRQRWRQRWRELLTDYCRNVIKRWRSSWQWRRGRSGQFWVYFEGGVSRICR